MHVSKDVNTLIEETPDRLLQAGIELFAQSGFGGVSLNRIARFAKTSTSSISHFYVNKEGLLRAICDRTWREINDNVTREVKPNEPALVKCVQALSAVLDYLENHQNEERLVLIEFKQMVEFEEGPLTSEVSRFKETLDDILRDGKKEGTFPSQLSVAAAREGLTGLMEGMLLGRMLDRKYGYSLAKYGKKEIEDIMRRAVRGLATETTRAKKKSKKRTR